MHFVGIILAGYIIFTTFGEYILGFFFIIALFCLVDLNSLRQQSSNKNFHKLTSNLYTQHKYAPNYVKREDINPMYDDSDGWDNKTNIFVKYPANLHKENHFWTSRRTFTVIDFETANAYSDSVCQIGIAKVVDNVITESFSLYVRPPYRTIREGNFNIHKISWNELANAKYFDELWPTLKPYIQDQCIAAYNADFDIGCLEALFNCYGIKNVSYTVFDILDVAKNNWRALSNYKLSSVTAHLNISLNPHQAESDAVAAAKIQIEANKKGAHVYIYCKHIQNSKNPYLFMNEWELQETASKAYQRMLTEGTKESSTIFSCLDIIIRNSNDTKRLAKAYRLCGETLELDNCIDEALLYYRTALSYDEKVGVKRKIKTLENKITINNLKSTASQIKI